MAPRLGLLAALAAALLTLGGTASAAPKPPSVKVAECDVDGATATFTGAMRTVPGARQLAMRFTLQARTPEQPAWVTVKTPGFDTWITARPGKRGFAFDKTVEGLAAPGDYRVIVRFRWRDASGTVLQRTRRTSKACVQPDPRPDLRPTALTALPGGGLQLTVANDGGATAPATAVALAPSAGAPVRTSTPAIAAGDSAKVRFDGITCAPGSTLTATVDPDDEVDEADEAGNALTVPCPS